MSFLKSIFAKEPELPAKEVDHRSPKPAAPKTPQNGEWRSCTFCSAVKTAGRSGEKSFRYVNGDPVTVEIINESHVSGRMCYTLNISNDLDVGWSDVPIKFCPFCGRSLKR